MIYQTTTQNQSYTPGGLGLAFYDPFSPNSGGVPSPAAPSSAPVTGEPMGALGQLSPGTDPATGAPDPSMTPGQAGQIGQAALGFGLGFSPAGSVPGLPGAISGLAFGQDPSQIASGLGIAGVSAGLGKAIGVSSGVLGDVYGAAKAAMNGDWGRFAVNTGLGLLEAHPATAVIGALGHLVSSMYDAFNGPSTAPTTGTKDFDPTNLGDPTANMDLSGYGYANTGIDPGLNGDPTAGAFDGYGGIDPGLGGSPVGGGFEGHGDFGSAPDPGDPGGGIDVGGGFGGEGGFGGGAEPGSEGGGAEPGGGGGEGGGGYCDGGLVTFMKAMQRNKR